MTDFLKTVPIPTAGVALGLVALGNLVAPVSQVAHVACGLLAACLLALLAAKVLVHPAQVRAEFKNPVFASVSATFFMATMQLTAYVAPVAPVPAHMLWALAVLGHLVLMIWFTCTFIARFKLSDVYPTYFICYVGIVVAALTSPTFGAQALGRALFVFGFACYTVLLVVVTLRYARHAVPESARPLFCIYAAPMSLSLAGYLAVFAEPNATFVAVLAVLAQLLFALVLTRLPRLLRLPFYPSYAAMTFPFVITATALAAALAQLEAAGFAVPGGLHVLAGAEAVFAALMVCYVTVRYGMHFAAQWRATRRVEAVAEA
jgi:exfoliative toxin A/B